MSALDQLRNLLHTVADLRAAKAVLEWDQETYMPPGAAESRAFQLATLERLHHETFTSDEVARLLDQAETDAAGSDPESDDAVLLRVTRRDFDRETKLPTRLVSELAETSARALEAWKAARSRNEFARFEPLLSRLVELCREKAHAIGFEEHPYDALLDEYEPEMRTATVSSVFADLRSRLVPIVETIGNAPQPDDGFLHQPFDGQTQWDFGMDVLRAFGYDFTRGRQDLSTHPFTTAFSIFDVRLTTRVHESFLPTALFGTLHEGGHGLYEQGIDPALARTPLADAASLGMHESQSRLWENLVGRSRPFWTYAYPRLQSAFSTQLAGIDLETFYRAVNRVRRSPIRVEADEVTYNLHIMVRFELELALLEGRLAVADLPEAWNETMRDVLGLVPASDAEGCLQDIHWSMGAIGYFPTYALGNLISTQLLDQARRDLPTLSQDISSGQFGELLSWLRSRIHRHGRKRSATRLLEDVSGEGLSADSWLAYVKEKYGELYGLTW